MHVVRLRIRTRARHREGIGQRATAASRRRAATLLITIALLLSAAAPAPAAQLLVAANHGVGEATLRSLRARAPWGERKPPIAIDDDAVLHSRGPRVYVVSRRRGTVAVVARRAWEVRRTFSLGDDSRPQDIVVLGPRDAYVTTGASAELLHLDPRSGAVTSAVDLSLFADEDGNPDLGAMIVDGDHLFVQVRRYNEKAVGGFSSPAYLAVIDLVTGQLMDVDTEVPGVQAIQLKGTSPKHRMQILPASRRLLVSATGGSFDAGGIESIDLDTLESTGLVLREDDGLTGSDLGPFAMVDEERGYLVFTTDFTLSSHLDRFSLAGGVAENVNMHVSVDYAVPAFGFHAVTGSLFVPDGAFEKHGIDVFDTSTDKKLNGPPIDVDGATTDVLLLGQ